MTLKYDPYTMSICIEREATLDEIDSFTQELIDSPDNSGERPSDYQIYLFHPEAEITIDPFPQSGYSFYDLADDILRMQKIDERWATDPLQPGQRLKTLFRG